MAALRCMVARPYVVAEAGEADAEVRVEPAAWTATFAAGYVALVMARMGMDMVTADILT